MLELEPLRGANGSADDAGELNGEVTGTCAGNAAFEKRKAVTWWVRTLQNAALLWGELNGDVAGTCAGRLAIQQ